MISIEDIKRHLNVDHNEDDDLIQNMIAAAIASVEKSIGAMLSEFVVDDTGALPDDLKHVLRIQVAILYENREGMSYGKITNVPFTISHLLAPYIERTIT